MENTEVPASITTLLPKGMEILNTSIDFNELVALNVRPLYKESEDVKSLFRPGAKSATVFSDADSQALFFVPFNNICKVHTILVKLAQPEASEGLQLDSEELADESQRPSLVKVWPNKTGILSFDDTSSEATHTEKLQQLDSPGWYEIKLRYVRFQRVQSLNIFVDGDDEDSHTLIEKIIFVGSLGESRDQGSLLQEEEE